jgi:hypothetical protein
MKKIVFIISIFFLVESCTDNAPKRPTTALDTGREFIRTTLDGDFKNAEILLYKDSLNTEFFETYKRTFNKLTAEKKAGYQKADIIVNSFTEINDSTSILDYSNNFMNQPTKIKLIKQANNWMVDFKYTTGDSTTTK